MNKIYDEYVLTPYLFVMKVESIDMILLCACLTIIDHIHLVCMPMIKGMF